MICSKVSHNSASTKKNQVQLHLVFKSGERGIRTPGGVTLNGFQDRRIRPLCHFSNGCKYTALFFLTKPFNH